MTAPNSGGPQDPGPPSHEGDGRLLLRILLRILVGLTIIAAAVGFLLDLLVGPSIRDLVAPYTDKIPNWVWIALLVCIGCYGVWDCYLSVRESKKDDHDGTKH